MSSLWDIYTSTGTTTGNSAHIVYPVTPPQPIPHVIPAGDNFMYLKDDLKIHAHGETYQLTNILEACRNVRYMVINAEIIIPKLVWEAILTYINADGTYADLLPSEFLDKMFSPKEALR